MNKQEHKFSLKVEIIKGMLLQQKKQVDALELVVQELSQHQGTTIVRQRGELPSVSSSTTPHWTQLQLAPISHIGLQQRNSH